MVQILNSQGQPVVLNARERHVANHIQQQVNALGYQVDVTTLTTILKKISEQKFYEIPFADYVPVVAGEGAWSQFLTGYKSFQLGGGFEEGLINTGSNNSRLASADAGVESYTITVKNWAEAIGWNLFDLELASKSGNWDLISAKEEARKRVWDLGLQRTAFLGLKGDSSVKGLLNQSSVAVNTTVINQSISSMSEAQLSALIAALYEAYRVNCARTAKPTMFGIPESDFNGLASQASETFPIKTKLDLVQEALQMITMNKQLKVMPIAYADVAYSDGALTLPRYVLTNQDEKSIKMNVPVPYTSTLANSIDNFNFQNVGYGQFTGVTAIREKETLYFDID